MLSCSQQDPSALPDIPPARAAGERGLAVFGRPRPIRELATEWQEKSPSLTCDERILFFDSNRARALHDSSETWRHGPLRVDIYEARRPNRDARFGEPRLVLRDARAPEISADGLELFFLREMPPDGSIRPDSDLFVTRRESLDSPFGEPKRIIELDSPYIDAAPSLTADGKTLYFHSFRPGGRGESDIWVATREHGDAPFGSPRNVSEVNTEHHEQTPSVTGDGRTLYFTTGRTSAKEAAGRPTAPDDDLDIVVSVRDPESGRFGPPRRIEGPVNTPAKEKAPEISCDGERLYYRSTRPDGLGQSDLWWSQRRRAPAPRGALGSDSILGKRPSSGRRREHAADLPGIGIRWEPDLRSALTRARKEDKPIFLAFNARRLGSPSEEFF
jgi:hypothetical protein